MTAVPVIPNPLTVARGGTGAQSLTADRLLYGGGTGAVTAGGALTSGRVALIGAGGEIVDDAALTYATGQLSVIATASDEGSVLYLDGMLGVSDFAALIFINSDGLAALSFAPGVGLSFVCGPASGPGFSILSNDETLRKAFYTEVGALSSLESSGGFVGDASTNTLVTKPITGIADNTDTDVLTVTIPNGAHSASIRVRFTGSLGAGGAIGANESTQDAEYMVNVTRTPGANAVATIGAVVGQAAAASVAGANNAAVTGSLGAVGGAVGATNTVTVRVKIVKSAGASANHTCLAYAELLNANGDGVTIT